MNISNILNEVNKTSTNLCKNKWITIHDSEVATQDDLKI
jgi:hypothetical protein